MLHVYLDYARSQLDSNDFINAGKLVQKRPFAVLISLYKVA